MTRYALVTGGAQGIGRAVAESLAVQGWTVVAADRDANALVSSQEEWQSAGLAISARFLDVTDRQGVADLVGGLPSLDVAVNCAAASSELLPFAQLDDAAWERMFRVNLCGSFIVAQEAARKMTSGAIVNIASRGYLGGAGAAHYVASKAAVVGLTRSLAIELRWRGISINAVAPGMVETRMIADFTDEMRAALKKLEPSGGALPPTTIAAAVDYLVSPAGRSVTGQVLLVDGGKSVGVNPF